MPAQKEMMLSELMSIDFTIIELNLYLNTHPNDQYALNMYNASVQKASLLRMNYERLYGPLTARYAQSKYPWQWIKSPWPWQNHP